MTATFPDTSALPPVPEMDPRRVPLNTAVLVLREEGERLFSQLLARNPLLLFQPTNEPYNNQGWWRGERHYRFPFRFRRRTDRPLTSRGTKGMRRAVGTFTPERLPPTWLVMAAEWAWNDLAFQVRVSRALRHILRVDPAFSETLWWAGKDPCPEHIAAEFFGLLVAISLGEGGSWPLRWLWELADRVSAHPACLFGSRRNLTTQARDFALRPGWAGFWEQWLIKEFVVSAQPQGWAQVRPPLRTAVEGLPLLTGDQAAEAHTSTLARADWHLEKPGWFHGASGTHR